MLEYPKTENLYVRDEVRHCIPANPAERALRRAEFAIPQRWLLTEKIDGTNIRVQFCIADGSLSRNTFVAFGGRTDAAQLPPFLLKHLQETVTVEKMVACFDLNTCGILFGEGYGPRIQKGGGNYRPDVSFRLFDVVVFGPSVTQNPFDGRVGWLDWSNVEDIASKLGISTVPVLSRTATLSDAIQAVEENFFSRVAAHENNGCAYLAEGVVARTDPLLFDRRGHRLVWKLKHRDFERKP